MSVNDVLYVLFRHKWKVIVCTILGLAGAATFYFFMPPPSQSEAMLLIRFVLENSTPGMPGNDTKAISPDQRGETIINTEVSILTSMDISNQVVDAVGVDKILGKGKGPRDREHAAMVVNNSLMIDPIPKTSVIRLIYKSHDPTVVQTILTAVVDSYLKKHVEVHRGAGAVGDFLSQETDQLRSRLSQTEDDLRKAKDKAGIISLDDSKRAYTDQVARIRQEIYDAEADLAERAATVEELAHHSPQAARPMPAKTASPEPAVPAADQEAYRLASSRLDLLQKTEQQLLTEFTDQNQRVKDVRSKIDETRATVQKLEDQYPAIGKTAVIDATRSPVGGAAANAIDLGAESARLSGLQSKIKVLNAELDQIRKEASNVDQMEGTISELQRQKDLEEANYKYYSVHLEANRIDEALGSGRALNIAEIQTPTPPHIDMIKHLKIMGGLAAAGLALGVAWAFLIELYLDRTIRRAQDVERLLNAPLFLSIPDFGTNGHNRHVFHETLRDRLIGYFESRNLTHKPKLLAVTGVGHKTGVTTTAAGLAQCLSETGEGNVLLVDMTQSQGSAQQFFKGKATCDIEQLLDTKDTAMVREKLYVVGAEPNSDRLSRALPARFTQLVPKLKASDFDYIIFDMPTVNQISITPRLAGFMDMVLLVVESERTDREIACQAADLLAMSKAPVGIVLNKSKSYLPFKTQHDFLGIT